jgi:formylglycine-generating enzyme required for sulfatase activity
MSRPGTVSRADLLRLLAACPDAPLPIAARLVGLQPEPTAQPAAGAVQDEQPAGYETEPASSVWSCQLERFWHLHSREPLQARPGRQHLRQQPASLLPTELRHLRPLRAKELCCTAPAPSSPLKQQPPITQLVAAAARLRPLSRQLLALPASESSRQSAIPPAALALQLLRAGQTLDRSQAEWLDQFLLRFVRTWFDRRKDAELRAYARRVLELLPDSFRRQHDSAALLYGIVHRDALRQGAVIPAEYRPERVLVTVQEMLPLTEWLLIQEGEEAFLVNSPESGICLLKGSRIAGLYIESDILLLHSQGQTATAPVQIRLPLISSLGKLDQFCLQTRTERLHIQTCTRPGWAALIGRNSRDLFAEMPWLGRGYRLFWLVPNTGGEGCWRSSHGPITTDSYGLSAYIGFYGRVMQRFRWLEPGRFLMGSPGEEPERETWGKETQHEVRLTKGFWLADTTVSQELWQFVMRSNPSHFQGRDLPVENVSWHEAQLFLQRLNAMVPRLNARLPTEAEWEYACRAGTVTPFAFNQISPDQVNYNGSYPYQGSAKGLFRRKTVAVGSLPANNWGLYEMHGNVWEWCQDWWIDDLGCDTVVDPQGPESSEFRVVRGGSWFLSGKGVRSAVRGRFAAEFRNDRIGFRIARDHEQTAQAAATPPVPEAEPAPAPSFLRRFFGRN